MAHQFVGPVGPHPPPALGEWTFVDTDSIAAAKDKKTSKTIGNNSSMPEDDDWIIVGQESNAEASSTEQTHPQEPPVRQRHVITEQIVKSDIFVISFQRAPAEGSHHHTEYERAIVLNWNKFVDHVVMHSEHWPSEFDTWTMLHERKYGQVTSSQGLAKGNLLHNVELFNSMHLYGFRGTIIRGMLVFEPVNILALPLGYAKLEQLRRIDWAKSEKNPIHFPPLAYAGP